MNYDEAVKLLTSQGKFRINLGLERIEKILELLDNPQDKLKCIHVAGTNGKGSVCAILSTILKHTGYKTGLYTSPHIFEYTERIQINNRKISKEDFAKYTEKICKLANENKIDLTEFEILTAVMFKYFHDKKVDFAVLETGLGGRFDATNVIKKNICSIITHIDYDHTERLGNTLDKIASEKAGIIKPNCPVITSEGYEVFKDTADKNNSLFILTAPFENAENLALKGLHQRENLALALACIREFFPQITENTIQTALKNVRNPFRFEYFKDKNMIIDVAHNPNGIEALKQNLDTYFPNSKRRFIFGCLKNKNYSKMINTLFERDDEIYFYHFDYPNSATIEELQSVCPYKSQKFKDKFDYTDGKLTIICGSFYMLKEILQKI